GGYVNGDCIRNNGNWDRNTDFDLIFEIWGTPDPFKSTLKKSHDEVIIYPNPFSNIITLSNAGHISQIEILNILGEVVILKRNLNADKIELDVNNLKSGYYLIRLTDDLNNVITMSIIKR
ncbi:MAG: T9SS type A sorting domain-containing protein, partial [Bacteroidales bacterium]|nr:T9SS type A sorting domain-containing protein [Bacteroidales bacterium]